MRDEAKEDIKKLIQQYHKRLGPEKAEKATRNEIIQNILTDDMYEMYTNIQGDDKKKREAWRNWIRDTWLEIFEDLSAGKDTTAANGMDASRVVSGAAADSTGMPAQSPSSTMLHDCEEQARKLSTELKSMHTDMQQWHAMGKSLMEKHTEFALRFGKMHMQLSKAVDAQGVGAAGLPQISVPPPGKATTADADMKSLSDAGAGAPSNADGTPLPSTVGRAGNKKARSASTKKPTDVLRLEFKEALSTVLGNLFTCKYPGRKSDNAAATEAKHVRNYFANFLAMNMKKLSSEVNDQSLYTSRDWILHSLLWNFQQQVKQLIKNDRQGKFKEMKEGKKSDIEIHTQACQYILDKATGCGHEVWEENIEVKTPNSALDTFNRERYYISLIFEQEGVPCSYLEIQLPKKMEKKTAHTSSSTQDTIQVKTEHEDTATTKHHSGSSIIGTIDLTLETDSEDEED